MIPNCASTLRSRGWRHMRYEATGAGSAWLGDSPLDEQSFRQQNADLARVFYFLNKRGYKTDIPMLRKQHPGLMDFDTWLEKEGEAKFAINRTGTLLLLAILPNVRPLTKMASCPTLTCRWREAWIQYHARYFRAHQRETTSGACHIVSLDQASGGRWPHRGVGCTT